jgi:hypothetical protein
MMDRKPLTAEEYAEILWPGLFTKNWKDLPTEDTFKQACFYCLERSEEMLETIEVYRK